MSGETFLTVGVKTLQCQKEWEINFCFTSSYYVSIGTH